MPIRTCDLLSTSDITTVCRYLLYKKLYYVASFYCENSSYVVYLLIIFDNSYYVIGHAKITDVSIQKLPNMFYKLLILTKQIVCHRYRI